MTSLVIAEHDNKTLKSSTANTAGAAVKLGHPIDVVVIGSACQGAAEAASQLAGVRQVLVVDATGFEHQLAEDVASVVVELAGDYSHVLAPATTFGKNFMPRVAAKLDVQQISDIIDVKSDDTFVRPIYAGNAIATVQTSDEKKVLTVRATGFDPVETTGSAEIVAKEGFGATGLAQFVSQQLTVSERPELTAAKVVVSGGRGMQNGENFKMIEALADKLGAAVGASRAAVDAGYVPNDYQVGQTGKIVAPDLYIAVGISGAIQHLAGMKDSKVIVAINKDEEAPIFQVADYGLVADLFDAVPQLTEALS